jgi:hypothetical protein
MDNNYLDQVKCIRLTADTRPRIFLTWENTEIGRDILQSYQRIGYNGDIVYENLFNKSIVINKFDPFFETLEKIYHLAIEKSDPSEIFTNENVEALKDTCNKISSLLNESIDGDLMLSQKMFLGELISEFKSNTIVAKSGC